MRNVLAIPAVLLVAVSSLSAQASLELAVSRATLRQSFAYDCCGPTRRTSGAGLGFRITWPAVRLIAGGVRCRFGRFAVGVEAAWVSGTSDGFRRFSTERYGLTLRMQP